MGLNVRSWSVLAITAVVVVAIEEARAIDNSNNEAEAEGETVTGEATESLTSVLPEESAEQNRGVPGAFTIKTNDDMELGRGSNFEDLLRRIPGVFLQSEKGMEVSKISIRGSGITSEDEPLGVVFLMDGLNSTRAMARQLSRTWMLRPSAMQKSFGPPMQLIRRHDTGRGN